jgi:L-alanine-DL-glutamate epimerase-like enolase superfamily enzyme
VEEVFSFPLSIPYPLSPPTPWREQWSTQLYVLAKGGGESGLGECLLAGGIPLDSLRPIVDDFLSPALIGSEVTAREANEIMRKLSFSAGLGGITSIAISGIDIALWDLEGKLSGKGVAEQIGGPVRQEVPVYASFPRYSKCEHLLAAVEAAVKSGFDMIKIHQPGLKVEECVRKVREAYPKLKIAVDLNCAFSFERAEEVLSRVNDYGVEWFEEPIWPPDDYASLKRLSQFPLAAGEDEYRPTGFESLIDAGVTYLQPDVMKAGGVTGFLQIADLAKKRGARLAPHVRPHLSYVGAAVTLQIASAITSISTVEFSPWGYPSQIFSGVPKVSEGRALLTQETGIGTSLSLAKYAYRKLREPLRFADLEA